MQAHERDAITSGKTSIIRFFLAFSLIVFFSQSGFALAPPGSVDIKLRNISCWADGEPLEPDDSFLLWNPTGEADVVRGGFLAYNWTGSGNLRCRYEFNNLTPWAAFELVSEKSGAKITQLDVTKHDGSKVQFVSQPQALAANRKFRANSDRVLGIIALEFSISVPCTNGKCSVLLSDISPFPEAIDVTALQADGRDTVFPNEQFSVRGSVSYRSSGCEGKRNICLWVSREECEYDDAHASADCSFACPRRRWDGLVRYLSGDEYSAGKCEGKGWWKPTIMAIVIITSIVLTAVSFVAGAAAAIAAAAAIGTTAAVLVAAAIYAVIIGVLSALAAWNPSQSFEEQWEGIMISFGIAAVTSFLSAAATTPAQAVTVDGQLTYVNPVKLAQVNIDPATIHTTADLQAAEATATEAGLGSITVSKVPFEQALLSTTMHAFQQGVTQGILQALYSIGKYAIYYFVRQYVVSLIVSSIMKHIDIDNTVMRTAVSAFVSEFVGTVTATIAAEAFSYAFANAASAVVDNQMSASMEAIAQRDFGQFVAETFRTASIQALKSGFERATVEVAAIPIQKGCDAAAGSASDKESALLSNYCSMMGKALANWIVTADKSAFFDNLGINGVPPLNFKQVSEMLDQATQLGYKPTDARLADKIPAGAVRNTQNDWNAYLVDTATDESIVPSRTLQARGLDPDRLTPQQAAKVLDEVLTPEQQSEILEMSNDRIYNLVHSPSLSQDEQKALLAIVEKEVYTDPTKNYQKYPDGSNVGPLAQRLMGLQDLERWHRSALLGSEMLQHAEAMAQMYESVQAQIKRMELTNRYQREVVKRQSRYIKGHECACFGTLRSNPQFLLEPVPCTKEDLGVDKTPAGRTLYIAEPEEAIGPPENPVTGIPEEGLGWCKIPAAEGTARGAGSIVALVGTTNVSGTFETGHFGLSMQAPSQPGNYSIHIVASRGATHILLDNVFALLGLSMNLLSDPMLLYDVVNSTDTLVGIITSPELAVLKSKLVSFSAKLRSIADKSLTLSQYTTDKISSLKQSLEGMRESASLVASSASNLSHKTTFEAFINITNNTIDSLNQLSASPTAGSAIRAGKNITRLSASVLSRLTLPNATISALDELPSALRRIPAYKFMLDWRDYQNIRRCNMFFKHVGTPEETYEFRCKVVNDSVEDVPFSDIATTLAIPLELSEGENFPVSHVDYVADFSNLPAFIESAASALNSLRDSLRASVAAGGAQPEFLSALANIDNNIAALSGNVSRIKPMIAAISGEERLDKGRLILSELKACKIEYCSPICMPYSEIRCLCPPDYACKSDIFKFVNVINRSILTKAQKAIDLLTDINGSLAAARDDATNAVWSSDPVLRAKLYTVGDELVGAQAWLMQAAKPAFDPIELNATIKESGLAAAVVEMSGAIAEGRRSIGIDVIKPEFSIDATPALCGDGEAVHYNVSVAVDATWPVIDAKAGWWTPFSVPYKPRVPITLADIAPGCDVASLAWSESGVMKKVDINADNLTLVPGRGYYVLSDNNCKIFFEASKFDLGYDAKINMSATGNTVSTTPILIGSAGYTIPFDTESLAHKFYDPWELWPEQLNKNCPQLGYELYDDFSISKRAGNWSYLIEAVPTRTYPTAPEGKPADMLRPGRAYWVQSDKPCALAETLPARLQTATEFGPKTVSFSTSISLPDKWSGKTLTDLWQGKIDDTCWVTSDPLMCAAVGTNGSQHVVEIAPQNASAGEYAIALAISNSTYGISSVKTVRYIVDAAAPLLSTSSSRALSRINYTISVTSAAPSTCQARNHKLYIEPPLGWNSSIEESSFDLSPGNRRNVSVALFPKPNAQGGWITIIALSAVSERSKPVPACMPLQRARDIATNGTHIFYTSEDGVHIFDTLLCNDEIVARSGYPLGVTYANGKIFWIDGAARTIKSYDFASNQVSTVTNVSSASDAWHIAADDESIYWIENSAVKKFSSGTVVDIATGLNMPAGLDAYGDYVYWAEPSRIRRVSKMGMCSGDECAVVADIPRSLLGPEPGKVQDIAAGPVVFVAVSNPQPERGYSKIMAIENGSAKVVAKPQKEFGYEAVTGIAASGSHVYWVAGSIDRISSIARASVFSEFLSVPGHAPSSADISPSMLTGVAGAPVRFLVKVKNNNEAGAYEPSNKFWIKDVELPDGIELCASRWECESANEFGSSFSRREILDRYAYRYQWIEKGSSTTFELWLRPKGTLSIGTILVFNVTVGSTDPAMDGKASGKINISAPTGPLVAVVPKEPWVCTSDHIMLEPGFANQTCAVTYEIQITNPEVLESTYELSVIVPANFWNISLERSTVTVPGRISEGLGWNQRITELRIKPIAASPLGIWKFAVNATNAKFPEKSSTAEFTLVVTPDNGNGICEPERGETTENTPDCASAFVCAFNGSCHNTTPYGVDWSARLSTGERIIAFGVCEYEQGKSKGSQAQACLSELSGGERKRLACSSTTGFCHKNCVEHAGKYFLVAKTANASYSSPVYSYNCPMCIGMIFSPLVKADLNLHRWRPELSSGLLNFSDWLAIIGEAEYLYAMAWKPSALCIAATKSVVDRGKELRSEIERILSTVSYPVDGQCSSIRARISEFVGTSEKTIEQLCRFAGAVALNVTRMDVRNATFGIPSNVTVEINNRGNAAYAQARCSFERARQTSNAVSQCSPIGAGESKSFSVQIPSELDVGNWSVRCDAVWSMFSDCAVGVGVDSRRGSIFILPPNTSLEVASYDIPAQGTQNEKIIIRIDVRNKGEGSNASVGCVLRDPAGAERIVESDVKFVDFGQIAPFRTEFQPEVPGEWLVERCHVYKIGSRILQGTVHIGSIMLVWPVCTSLCQQLGYDFGGCFAGATDAVAGPGEQGCDASEQCVCGRLSIIERSCERTGRIGTAGRYTATVRGKWQTGTSLRVGTTFFQNPEFEWRQSFEMGVHSANVSVYKGTKPIYITQVELACAAPPHIDVATPLDRATVSGTMLVRANVIDANASLYVDGVLYGDLNASGFAWDTTGVADGWHTLRIAACNPAGCESVTRDVRVQNDVALPAYDFTIEPSAIQSGVAAGNIATVVFLIKNTGNMRDAYTILDELNTTWQKTVAMNGVRFARMVTLDAGQQAEFTINISVPTNAPLGQNAGIKVKATSSSGLVRASGPHAITVTNATNFAPELLRIWHSPMVSHRGERVTFYGELRDRDGDAIVDMRVCKNANCTDVWCIALAGKPYGVFNCSITAPLAGNYSYWIATRTVDGVSISSDERKFYVSTLAAGPSFQTDVAKGGAATASSELPSQPASRATDGDASTYWVSESGLPQWLQVDLAQQRWVGGIGIYSGSPARPKSFDVLVGDCTNFATAQSVRSARYSGNWFRTAFDAISGKCVRINVQQTEDGSPFASIASFEVYEGVPGIPGTVCGNGVCDIGEDNENCPADCPTAPPGIPLTIYVIIVAGVVAAALWLWQRIQLWREFP